MKIGVLLTLTLGLTMTACGGTANLNRTSALKLVREHNEKSGDLKDLTVYLPMRSATYTDASVKKSPGMTATQVSRIMTIQRLNLMFYKDLVKKGIIKQEPECHIGLGNEPGRTTYCFTSVPPYSLTDPTTLPWRGSDSDVSLRIALTEVSRVVVTGIAENASHTQAQVDVEYDVTPAPAYNSIIAFGREMDSKYPDAAKYGGYWVIRLTSQQITAKRQVTYNFQKYDDGWRLEH